jgi:CHAT domain-containing protein
MEYNMAPAFDTLGTALLQGLSFVPFAALKSAGKKAKHLIQNHPIGTASSLRTLGWATHQYTAPRSSSTTTTSTTNPILFVADPNPLGVAKVPLDDSIKEVTDIAAITTMTTSTPIDEASSVVSTLTREQATLKNVTAVTKSASWCHFACHGEVNSESTPIGDSSFRIDYDDQD